MAMRPGRSRPLHNFEFSSLKWGGQKHLICFKDESSAETPVGVRRRSPPCKYENFTSGVNKRRKESDCKVSLPLKSQQAQLKTVPSRWGSYDVEEGIDEVREKIMLDLKSAADKIKDRILRQEVSEEEEDEVKDEEKVKEKDESVTAAEEARPWNLRTRKNTCKAPIAGTGTANGNGNNTSNNQNGSINKGMRIEEKKVSHQPMRGDGLKSSRVRGKEKERVGGPEKETPVRFCLSLTKKEIEEDFMTLVGHRPPRRPKKRPRAVQKQLETLFPGLLLTEVTPDSYNVPEVIENGKKH